MRHARSRREMLGARRKLGVARHDSAAAAGSDHLVAVEAECAHCAERAGVIPFVIRPQRLCGVFDQGQAESGGNFLQRVHIDRMAEGMHRHHRLDPASGLTVAAFASSHVRDAIEIIRQAIGIDS